jgi:hypothetical protein
MSVHLYSYWPRKDYEGDYSFLFKVLPLVEYSYSGSVWGNRHSLMISIFFWELEFEFTTNIKK